MKHLLLRTSPKGQPFVGTCQLCGLTGLPMRAMEDECENLAGASEGDALEAALNPSVLSPEVES